MAQVVELLVCIYTCQARDYKFDSRFSPPERRGVDDFGSPKAPIEGFRGT